MENVILTKDLRTDLKAFVQSELDQLPELMQQLEPKDRLTILTRILPFVLPRVDQIAHTANEPLTWE
jgi:HPt (histidine-containing phosphotransfer) domain-containing protein